MDTYTCYYSKYLLHTQTERVEFNVTHDIQQVIADRGRLARFLYMGAMWGKGQDTGGLGKSVVAALVY